MSAIYFAIPTNAGLAKIANAIALGIPLKITAMAVGDGGGLAVTPDPAMTTLPGEKRRAPLNTLFQDPLNPAQLVAEQIIPENVGGWWIRCVGLYDDTGTLFAGYLQATTIGRFWPRPNHPHGADRQRHQRGRAQD